MSEIDDLVTTQNVNLALELKKQIDEVTRGRIIGTCQGFMKTSDQESDTDEEMQ